MVHSWDKKVAMQHSSDDACHQILLNLKESCHFLKEDLPTVSHKSSMGRKTFCLDQVAKKFLTTFSIAFIAQPPLLAPFLSICFPIILACSKLLPIFLILLKEVNHSPLLFFLKLPPRQWHDYSLCQLGM